MGGHLFAVTASMMPQYGMSGVVTVALFIVGVLLANTGLNVDKGKIISSLPGKGYIAEIVIKNTNDTIILTRDSIKRNTI